MKQKIWLNPRKDTFSKVHEELVEIAKKQTKEYGFTHPVMLKHDAQKLLEKHFNSKKVFTLKRGKEIVQKFCPTSIGHILHRAGFYSHKIPIRPDLKMYSEAKNILRKIGIENSSITQTVCLYYDQACRPQKTVKEKHGTHLQNLKDLHRFTKEIKKENRATK